MKKSREEVVYEYVTEHIIFDDDYARYLRYHPYGPMPKTLEDVEVTHVVFEKSGAFRAFHGCEEIKWQK